MDAALKLMTSQPLKHHVCRPFGAPTELRKVPRPCRRCFLATFLGIEAMRPASPASEPCEICRCMASRPCFPLSSVLRAAWNLTSEAVSGLGRRQKLLLNWLSSSWTNIMSQNLAAEPGNRLSTQKNASKPGRNRRFDAETHHFEAAKPISHLLRMHGSAGK